MSNIITLHQLNSQNVDTRYQKYDKRVIAFIKLIIEDLEFSYKKIPTSFIASMDLLANLLKLYFISIDQLDNVKSANDLAKCRNTILQTSNAINKIATSFGGSPVDKARIKRLNSTVDDSDELLDDLING